MSIKNSLSGQLRAALDEIVLHPETGRIKWDRLLNLVGSGIFFFFIIYIYIHIYIYI